MTPRGINASGFYGITPMHIHPYATKVCTKVILDTFYTIQDFGTATRRTYPIINERLLPSEEGVVAGGAFNLPAAHIIALNENLCTISLPCAFLDTHSSTAHKWAWLSANVL